MDIISQEQDPIRRQALGQLRKRRDFYNHLLAYGVCNLMFVLIWAAMGRWQFHNFFWPIFLIAGWGMGLIFHAVDVFSRQQPTEQQIQREINRLRPKGPSPA